MNMSLPFRGARRWFSSAVIAVALIAAAVPATAQAQGRFGGGRSFGSSVSRGFGWGLGVGIGRALVYNTVYSSYPNYIYTPVYSTAASPTFYYVTQPAQPQTVVYNTTAPAPVASAPAPAAIAAPPAPTTQASKVLYDANAKPIGVLLLKSDGTQEFVPLAQ